MRKFSLAFLQHQDSEVSRIDWRISNTGEHEWHAAGVVQVPMSDNEGANLMLAFFEVTGVRNNVVNSRSIFCRKVHASIDNNYIVSSFNNCHVFADLFYSSERNYSNY